MPFILLVETLTTGSMVPRITTRYASVLPSSRSQLTLYQDEALHQPPPPRNWRVLSCLRSQLRLPSPLPRQRARRLARCAALQHHPSHLLGVNRDPYRRYRRQSEETKPLETEYHNPHNQYHLVFCRKSLDCRQCIGVVAFVVRKMRVSAGSGVQTRIRSRMMCLKCLFFIRMSFVCLSCGGDSLGCILD